MCRRGGEVGIRGPPPTVTSSVTREVSPPWPRLRRTPHALPCTSSRPLTSHMTTNPLGSPTVILHDVKINCISQSLPWRLEKMECSKTELFGENSPKWQLVICK